jgi:hypothetical protein
MGDHADISDASIEAAVARGIADVRSKASLQATRHCHFCDAEIGDALLFCDARPQGLQHLGLINWPCAS